AIDESYSHLPWTTVEEMALWPQRCAHSFHAEPIGLGTAHSGVVIALDSQQGPLDEVGLDEIIPPDINDGVDKFPQPLPCFRMGDAENLPHPGCAGRDREVPRGVGREPLWMRLHQGGMF